MDKSVNEPIVEAIKAAAVEVNDEGEVLIYLTEEGLIALLERLQARKGSKVTH